MITLISKNKDSLTQLLFQYFNHTNEMIVFVDASGSVIAKNDAAKEIIA